MVRSYKRRSVVSRSLDLYNSTSSLLDIPNIDLPNPTSQTHQTEYFTMQPLKSYLFASALALPLLVSYTYAQADTPEVVFDCSVTPSVCTNMCWGAYCSNYEVSLEFDNPSTDTKNQRRTKAGCKPNPNRCSGGDPNGSCDEYPFASTSNADDVQQVTRCVPGSENSSKFKPCLQSLFYCTKHS